MKKYYTEFYATAVAVCKEEGIPLSSIKEVKGRKKVTDPHGYLMQDSKCRCYCICTEKEIEGMKTVPFFFEYWEPEGFQY